MSSTIHQSISCVGDAVAMIVTDEVEAIAKTRVRLTLSFLYANWCKEKIHETFYCEGCEKGWPSQRDHMCAILSEEEIVEEGYDAVSIDLDVLRELCEEFLKLADLPMTEEWEVFINKLPLSSPQGLLRFWKEINDTWDENEKIIVDFVTMITNVLIGEGAWDLEPYLEFENLMMH